MKNFKLTPRLFSRRFISSLYYISIALLWVFVAASCKTSKSDVNQKQRVEMTIDNDSTEHSWIVVLTLILWVDWLRFIILLMIRDPINMKMGIS